MKFSSDGPRVLRLGAAAIALTAPNEFLDFSVECSSGMHLSLDGRRCENYSSFVNYNFYDHTPGDRLPLAEEEMDDSVTKGGIQLPTDHFEAVPCQRTNDDDDECVCPAGYQLEAEGGRMCQGIVLICVNDQVIVGSYLQITLRKVFWRKNLGNMYACS